MRKILFIISFLLILALIPFVSTKVSAATDFNYSANFSNGLPSDWKTYSLSDINGGSFSKSANGLTVDHSNTSITNSLYYGYVMQIGTNIGNVGDFVFEMDVKANSWHDVDRWIGLLHHTQYDSNNKLTGYMMIYRVKGKTCQTTISGDRSFKDSIINENAGVALSDKNKHTLKIVCSGTSVSHYIDNKLITTYDYTNYSTGLLSPQNSGGFGVIVNRMNVEISGVRISGKIVKPDVPIDSTIANCYDPGDTLVGDVSVNTFINSTDKLDLINDAVEKPSNAIMRIDEEMNVVDDEGYSLDLSIKDVYQNYLKGKVIPVVYIDDPQIAQEFIYYYRSELNIVDMAIASDDCDIVKSVRTQLTNIRGIVDWSNEDITLDDCADVVARTNASYANVVILNPANATYEVVRFIQARFKTVWVNNIEEVGYMDITEQVANEVYGVICDNYIDAFDGLLNFETSFRAINRAPYNVAHRGQSITATEQTIYCCKSAYEQGATHVEFDIRLSKDGKIVIMHDDTIDRTTNGSGRVNEMTLQQLQQYQVQYNCQGKQMPNYMWENIPSLEDFLKEFAELDIVLVCEIKSGEEALVVELKRLIEYYKLAERIVVISFDTNQIKRMKDYLPEVPTANLNNIASPSLTPGALTTLTTLNAGVDNTYGATNSNFTRQLALRGYSAWYWTYDYEAHIQSGMNSGCLGITNNSPEIFDNYYLRIEIEDSYMPYDLSSFSGDMDAKIITYSNKTENVSVSALYYEEYDDVIYAVFYYTVSINNYEYDIFSDRLTLINEDIYVSKEECSQIITMNASELTNYDYLTLKNVQKMYDLLTERDQINYDIKSVDSLVVEYEKIHNINQNNNQGSTTPLPAIGCYGSVATSLFGLALLATGLFVFRKKK